MIIIVYVHFLCMHGSDTNIHHLHYDAGLATQTGEMAWHMLLQASALPARAISFNFRIQTLRLFWSELICGRLPTLYVLMIKYIKYCIKILMLIVACLPVCFMFRLHFRRTRFHLSVFLAVKYDHSCSMAHRTPWYDNAFICSFCSIISLCPIL